jgi:trimeric autotransporter adhesin
VYFLTGGNSDATYTGAALHPGATAWTVYSDRNGKNNIRAIKPSEVLRKLASIPIATWSWKHQDASIRHMGPMAQDFHAAFGLGETEKGISTVDADGVAFAAIQGLHQRMQEKDREIAQLRRKLQAIEAKLGL